MPTLEREIEAATDKTAKIELYKELVALLKAIQPLRVSESRQLVGVVCKDNLGALGYPPPKDWWFPEITPLTLTDESILEINRKDQEKFPPSISTIVREPLSTTVGEKSPAKK